MLGGLPHLLEALGRSAHPDEVATALAAGPGRVADAVSASILWARSSDLVVLGLHGYTREEIVGLESVPLAEDYQLSRAFHDGVPRIDRSADIPARYGAMSRPGGRTEHVRARIPDGVCVSVPIVARGVPVGVFALNCASGREWSTTDVAVLVAAGAALGVWLTHPASGAPVDRAQVTVPDLTPRQLAVLRLLRERKTTAAIAATLAVSPSTVKQEITRILRGLRADTRTEAVARAVDLDLLAEAP